MFCLKPYKFHQEPNEESELLSQLRAPPKNFWYVFFNKPHTLWETEVKSQVIVFILNEEMEKMFRCFIQSRRIYAGQTDPVKQFYNSISKRLFTFLLFCFFNHIIIYSIELHKNSKHVYI